MTSGYHQTMPFISRYGRQPPVEPTSPIAMSLNEAGHHHEQNLSGSRSGQILWIRGLTRLQTQVGTSKHFTKLFFLKNFFSFQDAQAIVEIVRNTPIQNNYSIFVRQYHRRKSIFAFRNLRRKTHILCTVYTITAISVLPCPF